MKTVLVAAIACAGFGLSGTAAADQPGAHTMLTGEPAVRWGPPPPVFPSGAKFAVIDGDPAAAGLLTVRLMMPAGYRIPPHWHPTDEHVTVLSGTLNLGMGDVAAPENAVKLTAGGYAVAPAKAHHFAWTDSGAVLQVHMMGPFALTYVNPADDPTKGAER
jgi:quercetin dioxygenase-like cupin family protein